MYDDYRPVDARAQWIDMPVDLRVIG